MRSTIGQHTQTFKTARTLWLLHCPSTTSFGVRFCPLPPRQEHHRHGASQKFHMSSILVLVPGQPESTGNKLDRLNKYENMVKEWFHLTHGLAFSFLLVSLTLSHYLSLSVLPQCQIVHAVFRVLRPSLSMSIIPEHSPIANLLAPWKPSLANQKPAPREDDRSACCLSCSQSVTACFISF